MNTYTSNLYGELRLRRYTNLLNRYSLYVLAGLALWTLVVSLQVWAFAQSVNIPVIVLN